MSMINSVACDGASISNNTSLRQLWKDFKQLVITRIMKNSCVSDITNPKVECSNNVIHL